MATKALDHRQMNLWQPATSWQRAPSLPHIPTGAVVAVDSETRDEGLNKSIGPGWPHDDGWLCGVSYAWTGGADYLPVRDPDTECFDRDQLDAWLRDLEKRCTLVFQNATYDMGWCGLRTTKRIHDTHAAAVLLNENEFDYGLDAICKRLDVPGKDETALREAAAAMGVDPKKEMWKLPARFKGAYATQDAVATLGAHERQMPMIIGQKLEKAYELECALIPHIRDMRARGIKTNTDTAEKLVVKYRKLRDAILVDMQRHCNSEQQRAPTMEDIRSPKWLEWQLSDAVGSANIPRHLPKGKSMVGNPAFEKEWLERQTHPLPVAIAKARSLDECAEKFLCNYILGYVHRGRLHAEINQLRDAGEGTSKGTRSYRFSYGNPPLQQMVRPNPDKATPGHKDYTEGFVDVGTEIRSCFEPEDGEVFGAPDYGQQEYRWIVQKAFELKLPGAEDAVRKYQTDRKTDFHNLVVAMTGLTRKRAKDTNFAKAFGAGVPKFAEMTGMTVDEARATMEQYDENMPFVKKLAEKCQSVASDRGYVILLNGYRARFDTWEVSWLEPEDFKRAKMEGQRIEPCSLGEAQARRNNPDHVWHQKRLRRAKCNIAGNRVIQGSAAVQTKMALRAQADAGMLPLLQMHDELGHSVPNARYAKDIVEIMETVVQRDVPFLVDAEFGPTWGECKQSYEEATRGRSGGR